jgi:hypothetical protein
MTANPTKNPITMKTVCSASVNRDIWNELIRWAARPQVLLLGYVTSERGAAGWWRGRAGAGQRYAGTQPPSPP